MRRARRLLSVSWPRLALAAAVLAVVAAASGCGLGDKAGSPATTSIAAETPWAQPGESQYAERFAAQLDRFTEKPRKVCKGKPALHGGTLLLVRNDEAAYSYDRPTLKQQGGKGPLRIVTGTGKEFAPGLKMATAQRPEDVKTVVRIVYRYRLSATYTDGSPGYTIEGLVSIFDTDRKCAYPTKRLTGSPPPSTTIGGVTVFGSFPKVARYLNGLARS